jgi:putative endonuclease
MPSPAPRRPSNPRWLVYLLRCRDGSLYCGITNDLPKRLKAHAAGKASRYTRSRLPVTLAYTEPQKSKSAALKREAAIKRLRRGEKDRLVAGPQNPPVAGQDIRGPRLPRH